MRTTPISASAWHGTVDRVGAKARANDAGREQLSIRTKAPNGWMRATVPRWMDRSSGRRRGGGRRAAARRARRGGERPRSSRRWRWAAVVAARRWAAIVAPPRWGATRRPAPRRAAGRAAPRRPPRLRRRGGERRRRGVAANGCATRSRRRGERERLRDGRRRLRDESLDDDELEELELELEDDGERRPMVAGASLFDVSGCSQSGNDAEQQQFRAMPRSKAMARPLLALTCR